jgi:hypothetical protein
MDFPGGADWNVAWEPTFVLFEDATAANTRLLTDAQIEAAICNAQGAGLRQRLGAEHSSSDRVKH